MIEKLSSENMDFALNEKVTLPHDHAIFRIDYTALNFREPEKIQFRYRLEGLNDSWIDIGTDRSALYTKIPPGDYTFNVTASNSDGVWHPEGASFQIFVEPPFWNTNWFYSLVTLLFLTSGPSVYYWRVQKLKKENERQKRFTQQLIDSQEQERRRIAAELHDELGQQILIIKNRAELAQMQVDDPGFIDEQIAEIKESAVRSIADVRNISHGLRPVHLEKFGLTEAIETLCEQLERTSSIDWSYHAENIDGLIPKEKEINFYRIIQEATNNIQKHAMAKEAMVIVKKDEMKIEAKIWDNGKGFNAEDQKVLSGLGFSGMKERVETLGGILKVKSTKGEGTQLIVSIPT